MNEGKRNILLPSGIERKIDFLSSGERKGKSPKQVYVKALVRCIFVVVGVTVMDARICQKSQKCYY